MNWQIFGTFGYLGILLAAGAVLCWVLYAKAHKRLLCRVGLGLSIGALVCAMLNSAGHVSRIQTDPAERVAEMESREKAKRQALVDGRGEEVAQIRFAEDGGEAYLDKAGMDEEDLKYFERNTEGTPEWKKEKAKRNSSTEDETGLEGLIDDEEQAGGADVAELEEAEAPSPILMGEAAVVLANRVDRWNLDLAKLLFLVAVGMLGFDYLRRANIYSEATVPLPLPSAWTNAVTPIPAVVKRPHVPRRALPAELSWLSRRGDSFVYLTDDREKADEVVARMGGGSGAVLRVVEGDVNMDDDFVFEALWYGRGSFVVDSGGHAERMLTRFLALLRARRATRARVRQTVHVVWDLGKPVPESVQQAFIDFAGPAGFSLFVTDPKYLSS